MNRSLENVPVEDSFFDYVVIGSGFGGSVSAMRLAEKGYSVLVLERGKRFQDEDFPRTNWNIWKFLWFPILRCFGIWEMTLMKCFLILHGSGVGGGSLFFAGVLMEPSDRFFEARTWSHFGDWKEILSPHYAMARHMLGVATNPKLWSADHALKTIAEELGMGETFRPTDVGVFFGPEGEEVPDPYFEGEGPARSGCIHCGGCMVGCRYNSKNTLDKNYLYFAEKWGADVRPEVEVQEIRPLPDSQPNGARYEIRYRSSTSLFRRKLEKVQARNVVVSAGVLGTIRLLLRCRDELNTLPSLSPRLGESVRSNSEAFLGTLSYKTDPDHSEGLAITSVFQADDQTQVEPVRFSDRSSLMFWLLGTPLIRDSRTFIGRLWNTLVAVIQRPLEFIYGKLVPGLTRRSTALMVMQTEDNIMRLRRSEGLLQFLSGGLASEHDVEKTIPVNTELGHRIAHQFSEKMSGKPFNSIAESLFNIPMTAHILGGCTFGRDDSEGVIGLNCEVHNYPGLFVVDGSIVPANPGINPTLTITALAEYAMSLIPEKE